MKLGEWIAQFNTKYRRYLDELCEAGEETATTAYADADQVGNIDATVTSEPTENGFKIVASGADVNFLEFGAGVLAGASRPTVQAGFDISPGSWSASESGTGEFARYGSWHYKKQKFFGLAPAAGMQEACNRMEQESPSIAKRVFQ